MEQPIVHPLSFSGTKVFKTCPKKFHAEKIEKRFPFTENKHTIYGKEVHTAAEEYIRDGVDLIPGYEQFRKQLDAVYNLPGEKLCEVKMAVTHDRKPCDFYDKNAWYRGIVDLASVDEETAFVVDYKTGSAKYPDRDQLELMALLLFAHYPKIKRVKGGLLFMLHDKLVKGEYLKTAEDALWENWEATSAQIDVAFTSGVWNPKPNGLCRSWCGVEECVYCGA